MVGCSVLGCKSRSEKMVEGITFHNCSKTECTIGDGLQSLKEPGSGLLCPVPKEKRERHVAFWNHSPGRRCRSRKQRSRSSTETSREAIRLRHRSPSVSPVQALQSAANCTPISKLVSDECTNLKAFALRNGVTAFFSPCPPIEPMHIVYVDAAHSCHHHVQPDSSVPKIQELSEVNWPKTGDSFAIDPPVFLADIMITKVPPAIYTASSRTSTQVSNDSSKPMQCQLRKMSTDMVRLLLIELVSNLPLCVAIADASTSAISAVTLPRSDSKHEHNSDQPSCNIAVQAQAYRKNSTNASHVTEQGTDARGEEWVGGVRALRDSHVRLVLHQLRHIDRLNRTIDRTFRSRSRSSKRPLL